MRSTEDELHYQGQSKPMIPKIKYYLNNTLLLLIVFAVILIFIVLPSHAGTLSSSNTYPHKIFKCQASTVTANYTSYSDITQVTAQLTNQRTGLITLYPMTDLGSGYWTKIIGNDNLTAWGNVSVNFIVTNTTGATYSNSTTNYIFIYSDDCIGSNIQGYRNTSYRQTGFGDKTRKLFTGEQNILEFSAAPFIDYFGYVIYFIILFMISGVLYIKTQSVVQPLIIAFISVAIFIASIPVVNMPDIAPYKMAIMMIMGVAMAAIFWRLFKG